MDGLTEGRIVHYVLDDRSPNVGQHRPAIKVLVGQFATKVGRAAGATHQRGPIVWGCMTFTVPPPPRGSRRPETPERPRACGCR